MYNTIFWFATLIAFGYSQNCVTRSFGYDSIVCVCNSTYCDSTPNMSPEIPDEGTFYWYTSSKSGLRMSVTTGKIDERITGTTLHLNSNVQYQTIEGFGGAFTDAAGINIRNLSDAAQNLLMQSYFGPEGSRYNLGRVPIAGCDFSTRPYTYDDFSNDRALSHFNLAEEDTLYKIPLMKKALDISNEVKFFAAAWTAPPWMKTNDNFYGLGFLKEEYYQTFADYIIKFLDAYRDNGIDIWAISTGNEPSMAYVPFIRVSNMAWTDKTVAKWVAENLGPSLSSSTAYNKTLILAIDDQRYNLPWFVDLVFKNPKARDYISGIAVHFYWDSLVPANVLDITHNRHPDKFILMTEACAGDRPWDQPKVQLGSWSRAERYILDIMENLNHWVTGWVDWNLALDDKGGPNWVENFVDSPIIVNPENDEFYKQPMYYAIKHISRFVSRGSKRISITDQRRVKTIAFLTPDNQIVVVLYNKSRQLINVQIKDQANRTIPLELLPYSINTIIYRNS